MKKIKYSPSLTLAFFLLLFILEQSIAFAHEPLCPAKQCNGSEIIVDRTNLTNEQSYITATCAYRHTPAYTTKEGKRVDCLTPHHAIEYDWATNMKSYQAVGQALRYARETGLRAGIVFIYKNKASQTYHYSVMRDIRHFNLPIDVWIIK